MTNQDLIADPAMTLTQLAGGIGHFIRLGIAGYIDMHPEVQARMAALLANPAETVVLTGTLRAGRLRLELAVQGAAMPGPKAILTTDVVLPDLVEQRTVN